MDNKKSPLKRDIIEGYIPREGEENIKSTCDCCGKLKLIHRYNPYSDFMFCDSCAELND